VEILRPRKRFEFLCELVIVVAGFDLYSYHVHELLVSLALFSVAFLLLAITLVAAVLLWWASEQLANKSGPHLAKLIAFSRRLMAAYAKF